MKAAMKIGVAYAVVTVVLIALFAPPSSRAVTFSPAKSGVSYTRVHNGCAKPAARTIGPEGGRPSQRQMIRVRQCWGWARTMLNRGVLVDRSYHVPFDPALQNPGSMPRGVFSVLHRYSPRMVKRLNMPGPCEIARGDTNYLVCRGGFWTSS